MSEKEAIEYLSTRYLVVGSIINPQKEECEKHNAIVDMAIQALEKQSMVNELMHDMTELKDELEEYKEIGTVKELARLRSDYERVLKYNDDQGEIIDSYEAIGTLDECREAVERMKPKNTIKNDMSKKEMVNHPSHYNISGRKECIVEMLEKFGKEKVITFCELNAYKYHYRHEMKNGQEDLDKAKWYEDYAEKLKGE
jgi:hypothetical protein